MDQIFSNSDDSSSKGQSAGRTSKPPNGAPQNAPRFSQTGRKESAIDNGTSDASHFSKERSSTVTGGKRESSFNRASLIGSIKSSFRPAKPDQEFLERRKLAPPFVNSIHLWGVISGIILGGFYANFNPGLKYGFGSMIVASCLSSSVFIILTCMFADLGTVFAFSSGCAAYSFAAFGGIGATVVGYSYLLEFLLLSASVSTVFPPIFALTSLHPYYAPLIWAALIGPAVLINMRPKLVYNFSVITTIFSYTTLLIIVIICASKSDFSKIWETPMPDGTISTDAFPFGFRGVLDAMPYAVYMYLGFEVATVTAEEVVDIKVTLPRASWMNLISLVPLGMASVVVGAALPIDRKIVIDSSLPFVEGLAGIFNLPNGSAGYKCLVALMIPGNLFNLVAYIYSSSRYMYGMSRGGYLPTYLALTTQDEHRSPYVAVIVCGAIIFLIVSLSPFAGSSWIYIVSGSSIMACLAYLFDSIVYLKVSTLNIFRIHRPAKSVFGTPGAIVVVIISGVTTAGLIWFEHLYQVMALVIVGFISLLIPYYLVFIRRNLIDSPESMFIRRKMREQARMVVTQFSKSKA